MLALDHIYNMDCLEGMKQIPDKSIDLIVTDPPYEVGHVGGGHFGGRKYYNELAPISQGISDEFLEMMMQKCKKPNMYVFCSKHQVPQLLNFSLQNKLNYDILTWHKTNPTPACDNTYLSDTEYLIFMRAKGVPVFGSYETKAHYFITPINKEDKDKWNHPTIKPLNIIRTLLINSSTSGGGNFRPFYGKRNHRYCLHQGAASLHRLRA